MSVRTSPHPTDQTLSAYGLGKLEEVLADAVGSHLEQCEECRNRVAELSADSFLERAREAQEDSRTSAKGESRLGGSGRDPGVNPLPPPAETLPPGLADHPDYEIKKELGRGGMGVVYLAHNSMMGRDEVLKVMGRQIMERPGVLDRFSREIKAVAKLRHPNIVTAYTAFRLNDSIVFAMEFVDGLDLSKMVKTKGPLPVAHACNFIYQAALGLQHAHEEGLVHRDIKPGNLMLARAGQKATIKVLDFGLAKVTREQKVDGGLTSVGQALGTPDFIAPEQIIDAQSADIRADIYSLGGTLYYLLTGRPPFKANSLYDIYQAHISRDADPLNLVRPEVPFELAALVGKMMAKDPSRRFQTPGEVAEGLKPFFRKGAGGFVGVRAEVSVGGQFDKTVIESVPAPTEPDTDAVGTRGGIKKSVDRTVDGGRWESLIRLSQEGSSGDFPMVSSPTRKPPRKGWAVALAGSLLALLAMGVIVITIKNQNREIRVQVPDDGPAKVEHDGVTVEVNPSREKKADAPVGETPAKKPGDAVAQTNSKPVGTREFLPLFNGTDLTGWMFPHNDDADWTVVRGSIVGSGTSQPSVIATDRSDYEDFHLRMEVRTFDNLNKNLDIRASFSEKDVVFYNFLTGVVRAGDRFAYLGEYLLKLGGVFNDGTRTTTDGLRQITAPTTPGLAKNTWQRIEIIANGSVFRMVVDGREVSAFEDTNATLRRGHIAIRLRQGGQIEIRNIEIKELNAKRDANNQPPERPYVPLFNGSDLDGWAESANNHGTWKVVDGVLEGRGSGPPDGRAILMTRRQDFTNFRLRVKFRYREEGYGQIEIRYSPVGGGRNGYLIRQSSWPNTAAGQTPVGSIFKAQNLAYGTPFTYAKFAVAYAVPINVWNQMEIVAVGGRITTSVNGKQVASYVDTSGWHGSGGITLVALPQVALVEYQEITIQELPE
jgi:serine/threonine protein kinase